MFGIISYRSLWEGWQIEWLQLEYFKVVAQLGHITKASEILCITQPSLSNTIRRLEEEVGVQLFDRRGRNIQLNEYGKLFLEGVESATNAIASSIEKIRQLKMQQDERVTIIAPSLQAFPDLIKFLVEKSPHIAFLNGNISQDEIIKKLKSGEADFCISIVSSIEDSTLAYAILEEDSMYAVVSSSHRLAGNDKVRLTDLKDEHFASFEKNSTKHSQFEGFCKSAGFAPRIMFEGTTLDDVLVAVSSGKFIAMLSWNAYRQNRMKGIACLKIVDPILLIQRRLYWSKVQTNKSYSANAVKYSIVDFFSFPAI